MIAIFIGIMWGAAIAWIFGPAIALMLGIIGALVLIAYAFGQAVHDVRHGAGQ